MRARGRPAAELGPPRNAGDGASGDRSFVPEAALRPTPLLKPGLE